MKYEERVFVRNVVDNVETTADRSISIKGIPTQPFFELIAERMSSARRELLCRDLPDISERSDGPPEVTD